MTEPLRVIADRGRCQGYASCVITDPDRFDLGADGRVEILDPVIAEGDLARAEEAVRACPAQALRTAAATAAEQESA